jgi:uncharacterized protein (DUF1810 family)
MWLIRSERHIERKESCNRGDKMTRIPETSAEFDLKKFILAQKPVYAAALGELKHGRKRPHWIWFVFPQVEGLGASVMSQKFPIASRAEAAAYVEHLVLGARLIECTNAVLEVPGKSALEIFGSPDDMKFCSSMTLFETVSGNQLFPKALERFYGGQRDRKTLDILKRWDTLTP